MGGRVIQGQHEACQAWQQLMVRSRRVANETSSREDFSIGARRGDGHRAHHMGSSRTQRTSRRTDRRDVAERRVGIPPTWSGGAAIGFLSNTPDGTAFAFNLHADRFLQRNVSLGPLVQLGFTGDLTQVGFSGQGKYWIDLPETDNRAKVVLQAGIGFVHADFFRNDTSWLIPLGIGVDYALTRTVSLTGTFLLNFTDLDTGPGTDTNVMPGLTFGIRF